MYCGYIVELKNGRKHSNADRLKCYEIFGQNVITDLTYNDGDAVVYFPSDGQLSEEYCIDNKLTKIYKPLNECTDEEKTKQIVVKDGVECVNVGGYLEPDKRNIKAVKLRGEQSDGIVMHLESLSKYTDISKLKVGEQITTLDGHEICRKYIPKRRHRSSNSDGSIDSKKKNKKEEKFTVSYPNFVEHVDTEQLAYNEKAFHEGDLIYITRKCHGSSQRFSNTLEYTKRKPNFFEKLFHIPVRSKRKYVEVSGTRRITLRDYDGGYYGNNAFRHQWHEFFSGKVPKGMEVYFEVCGWVNETTPIMPSVSNSKIKDKAFTKQYGEQTIFTYGCEPGKSRIFVYRITMANEDGVTIELPTEQCIRWCEMWGCEFVPVLDKFFYTTWEDLNARVNKWLDIPEPLADGKHIVEGVVCRIDNRNTFKAYKAKSIGFKILEGLIKEEAIEPDMEEAQEVDYGDDNIDDSSDGTDENNTNN